MDTENRVLVFDVDGTLTGPRRRIQEDFARFFRAIVQRETVYLVSGSDMPKLQNQLPEWLLDGVKGVFPCSGNEMYENGEVVYRHDHEFPSELKDFAQSLIDASAYEERLGNHIEKRTGMLNISVVGRNAGPLEREQYSEYDHIKHERCDMAKKISNKFPNYDATCSGQISIDVAPKGFNKSRLFDEMKRRHPDAVICFFGDNIGEEGNDRPLATALLKAGKPHKVFGVRDYTETWKILEEDFTPDFQLAS